MKKSFQYMLLILVLVFTTACGEKSSNPDEINTIPTPADPVISSTPIPTQTLTPSPTPELEYVTLDNVDHITLPEKSSRVSLTLAKQLLALCSGHTAEKTKESFEYAGFDVQLQANFDKADDSREHTSAYTVGTKFMQVDSELRLVVLVAVRGTNAGEWYSNFDLVPSRDMESKYAENFLYTAQNALLGVQEVLDKVSAINTSGKSPLVIVCGHSRGAATANLLGMLLDELLPQENIFVYTYATPATISEDALKDSSGKEQEYPNIFNFINLCDIVPEVPLKQWNYKRVGVDMLLDEDKELRDHLNKTIKTLVELAPSLDSYYNDLHCVSQGLISMNLTTYQLMQMMASVIGVSSQLESASGGMIPDISDVQNKLNLGGIFEGSDFEKLFKLFDESEDGISAVDILNEHMPARYLELLEEMEKRD